MPPLLLSLEDPVLAAHYHAGNPAYKDDRFEYPKSRFDYYAGQLKLVGVNRRLLWEEYRQQQLQGYSHTQFCFHLSQHLLAGKPWIVLCHEPAEKLFIDFCQSLPDHCRPGPGTQAQRQGAGGEPGKAALHPRLRPPAQLAVLRLHRAADYPAAAPLL